MLPVVDQSTGATFYFMVACDNKDKVFFFIIILYINQVVNLGLK
jgi:hypothetical protein